MPDHDEAQPKLQATLDAVRRFKEDKPYGEVLDEMEHEAKYQPSVNFLALLQEVLITLNHARVFISTREKMHPVGVGLYDDLVRQIEEAIGPVAGSGELIGGVAKGDGLR